MKKKYYELKNLGSYQKLYKSVEKVLLLGQREIEEAKVKTYWHTGKLIHADFLQHESRAEYGKQVVEKLAADLKVSTTLLWRCIQFARTFKILAPARESAALQLSWSHYVELVKVVDEETRSELMDRAIKSDWSRDELVQKIRQEVKKEDIFIHKNIFAHSVHILQARLIPRVGKFYTYRILHSDSVHKNESEGPLRVDLGFEVRRFISGSAQRFKGDEVVESVFQNGNYSVRSSSRTKADLFTYKATVERVVDGDTLVVKIDLGFDMEVRQYPRLRGLDCAELDSTEGKRAKAFVVKELAKVSHITLVSSKSDKYDRYLADIFYGDQEIFLNQLLLDKHLAKRM